jgi:hypothetical protein
MLRLLITGAAGSIGSVLRAGLRGSAEGEGVFCITFP